MVHVPLWSVCLFQGPHRALRPSPRSVLEPKGGLYPSACAPSSRRPPALSVSVDLCVLDSFTPTQPQAVSFLTAPPLSVFPGVPAASPAIPTAAVQPSRLSCRQGDSSQAAEGVGRRAGRRSSSLSCCHCAHAACCLLRAGPGVLSPARVWKERSSVECVGCRLSLLLMRFDLG